MLSSTAEYYGAFEEPTTAIDLDLGVQPFGEGDQDIRPFEIGVVSVICSARGRGSGGSHGERGRQEDRDNVRGPEPKRERGDAWSAAQLKALREEREAREVLESASPEDLEAAKRFDELLRRPDRNFPR